MIGNRIKKLRTQKQITQEELGKIVGVTTSMIGMYETNARKPSYEVLTKMADYFNATTDYLLGVTDTPYGYIISDDEYPEVLKPFLKADSQMIVEFENNKRETPKKCKKAIEKYLKSISATDHPNARNN
jgi:transcriptional regulator with XRE-family HTH domain